MTARVSCSSPSGPHMCPEVRIIAGIEASTMTSLGTCRLVMPRLESTMASSGPVGQPLLDGRLDLGTLGQRVEAGQDAAQAVVRAEPGGGQGVAVPGEHLGQERPDHVAEDDRVGDLHHRRLEVDREQHVLGLGPGDLGGEELLQRGDVHRGGVDHLAGQHRHRLAQHRGGAVVADQLDPQRAVGLDAWSRSRWTGSRRRSCARRWSWSRPTRRPSSAGGSGRTA